MQQITFVTGNTNKVRSAKLILNTFGIMPIQAKHEIVEIQSEDTEIIVRNKAAKAFSVCNSPVVVTDDCWEIPALRGFPGPYMHSMNTYLTAKDWLRLLAPLDDRRIYLVQQLAYQDETEQKLFTMRIPGTLLTHIQGDPADEPAATLISLTGDGKSIAEVREAHGSALLGHRTCWHMFGEWLQQRSTIQEAT